MPGRQPHDSTIAYPIPVRLAPEPRERMRALAERHRRSLNAEVQIAVDEYLERHKAEEETRA